MIEEKTQEGLDKEIEEYLDKLRTRFMLIDPSEYYLSYSGGKDSHLIYWFIKEVLHDDKIEIVGCNTYMEWPEILQRILKYSDTVLQAELKPFDIKKKYGIPCFSKQQDFFIYYYQNALRKGKEPSKSIMKRITGGRESYFNLSKKAREYVLSGQAHNITHLCCYYLKKKPFHDFEKRTGKKPILGIRREESLMRKAQYKNCFAKDGTFTPLHDLPEYLEEAIYNKYNIPVPSIYKHISRSGCFLGSTEVCTDQGFKRLDSLNGTEKILSVDKKGERIFREYQKVEIPYKGNLVKVKLQNNKYVLCTPDHKFLAYNKDKKEWMDRTADRLSRCSIPSNLRFEDEYEELSPMEKLYIAIQADGSLSPRYNNYTYRFHLKKARKIKRLNEILNHLNIRHYQNDRSDGTVNINLKIDKPAKDLWACFDVSTITTGKAKAIIEEMINWDGHKDLAGRYCYCSANKRQADFYALIASIAGYSHYEYEAKPKKGKQIIYHLMVYTHSNRNFAQVPMQEVHYEGTVHCVNTGGYLCLFREKGKTFVAYNCICCPYGSYFGETEKEFEIMTDNQRQFVTTLFHESYDVLGVKYNPEDIRNDKYGVDKK